MKSIMISIQPQWCELIANGKKTIEVRKTRPKIDTPFKCYIYCTEAKCEKDRLVLLPYGYELGDLSSVFTEIGNGKVIGEFVCDSFYNIPHFLPDESDDIQHAIVPFVLQYSCLQDYEIDEYLGAKDGYGWHISDLVIYDKPKVLSEFKKAGFMTEQEWLFNLYPNTHCHYEAWAQRFNIEKPPKSWCFVEEM